jgi:NAD(P)-dependent dehydrogenase (short-subunit alcohol dehydrogenase family)
LLTGGQAALLTIFLASVDEQSQRVQNADAYGTIEGDIGTLGAAGVSALLDQLNLGIIFERVPEQLRNRMFRILASGTSEGATEMLQAISSNLIAQQIYDPESGILDDAAYEDIWHRALTVMLTAHQRMVRAALPHLRQSDAARIVNIASTEGLGATPGDTPYVAAKTGVIGLTRGLAVDLGPEGITVNCICPGPIRTAMTDAVAEEHKTIFAKRRTALRRYGEPEEVAHMTLSLVLPAASYLNGVAIPVDGGLMARNA